MLWMMILQKNQMILKILFLFRQLSGIGNYP